VLADVYRRLHRRTLADRGAVEECYSAWREKAFLCARSHDRSCGRRDRRCCGDRNLRDCRSEKAAKGVVIHEDYMIAARTRRGASRGGRGCRVCLCGVASRRQRRSESVASPPDEVPVRGRYEHVLYDRVWTGILAANAGYCDDEILVWCVSLRVLPKGPGRIEGRGEARVVRISLWHLGEVDSAASHSLQDSSLLVGYESHDDPEAAH